MGKKIRHFFEQIKFKEKIIFLKYLLVSIFLFLISLFFDESAAYFNFENSSAIDEELIERALDEKEKKIAHILTELTFEFSKIDNEFITNESKKIYSYDSVFFSDKYLNLSKEGINLLIYKDDSLKFWTSNLIPLSIKYSDSYLGDRIVDLNNSIYRVIIQKKARYIFVGLIHIKNKYSYQNSLLKNSYNPEFNLSENIELSLIRETYGFYINDANGNFLFTLIPSNSSITEKPFFYISVSFYLLSLVFFLYFINILVKKLFFFSRNDIWLLFLVVILLYIKYLLAYYQLPTNIYFTDLYKPDIFAYSDFLPSVSEFLQLSFILFFIGFNFATVVKSESITRQIISFQGKSKLRLKQLRILFIYVFPILLAFYYYFVLNLVRILIVHSTIPFEIYKILNLNLYSFIGLIIIGLQVSSFVLILYNYVYISSKLIQFKGFLYVCSLFLAFFFLLASYLDGGVCLYSIIYLFVLLLIFVLVRFFNIFYPYYFYVFVLFISTIFIIFYIDKFVDEKDLEIRNTLILPVMQEHDDVAEHILNELSTKIKKDSQIDGIIFTEENAEEKLKNHLYKKHYPALWEEYDLNVSICKSSDSLYVNNLHKVNCFDHYAEITDNQGVVLGNSKFYFLDNQNGRITYFGVFEYVDSLRGINSQLFLELNSKLRSKVIGFPKVLIDESYYRKSRLEEYSYAKYINNKLENQKGSFSYKYNLREYNFENKDSAVFFQDSYQHLVRSNAGSYTVIISRQYRSALDMLVSLSYIFVLYYMFLNIVLMVNRVPFYYQQMRHGLKFRIQFSMISILFLSILTVGGLSIYYIIKQSERNYNKNVKLDLTAVINELEYEYDNQTNFDSIPQAEVYQVLKKIANIFATDIHMYSTSGDLIASSTPEIFDRELLGRKLAPLAFKNLHVNGENYFNFDEKLGELEYLSAYARLMSINNEPLAYINMPFFAKEKILQEEVSSFVVSVINIFALLLLISVIVAIFISNKIVQPLRLVQSKFSEIQLGKTNEQILYSRDDEIGGLIKEYNRMLVELAKSAEMLGKSEREGAWREMAKQIAHEIKNPLTPMKLSLQLLKKSWTDKDPAFPIRIENVSNTLIEQIDRLSSIATSFSNFARIPSAQNKKFNIRLTLESALRLFENYDDLTLLSNLESIYSDIYVFADEEQISRAFINLIKNAHQAKKKNIDCFIHIELLYNEKRIIVKIIDNGTGIPDHVKEHLFRPNFTTKTSGMGLGLSIVKNIIENANGKVWFETEVNIGTTFYIELPVYQEERVI